MKNVYSQKGFLETNAVHELYIRRVHSKNEAVQISKSWDLRYFNQIYRVMQKNVLFFERVLLYNIILSSHIASFPN